MGPGAKHRQEGCRESGRGGRGRGRGPWNGAAEVWNRDPERAASRPGPGQTGVGAPVSATDSRHPAPGSRPESAEGSRTRLGRGDRGSGIWEQCSGVRPVARKDPPSHRPLFLTSQQAAGPVWRRSVPSRAPQLPGAE